MELQEISSQKLVKLFYLTTLQIGYVNSTIYNDINCFNDSENTDFGNDKRLVNIYRIDSKTCLF